MQLNDKQKKHLRSLAHNLKPIIQIGTGGISAGLANELNQTLEHHELVKTKLRVGDRDARNAAIKAMVTETNACLVARIGNTAILYRRREKNPGIELP
ncbi:MAG: ribosome assembly RNA-binding protein YhbY [Gammaproteobacteria bacterium]|jgi:RNA-binding protein|nr:ribosome assembly RNA-binding protein YhbY [Gammaproteobacteria bacterium]MDP7153859.1 ribosome assembly RNA-binding protein YhbY [Gammaproteobacteria bacterium]MDP7296762.1 ribosome assembly RNA-binding protein YhbY [Gammaproteobacteria bacterium]MDP7418770.1 ribosome assembly RNA-binding protein YhbY [Gammaproteobacteria bacterium]MDP7660959.1 ribosome assembly RNA-binding protein YhbY [Gammaproteobacteria bacterium]